jgi:hypothetical protein
VAGENYERLASPHRYALNQIRDTLARTRPGFEADSDTRGSLKQRYPPAQFFGVDFARELRLRAYYPRTEGSHLSMSERTAYTPAAYVMVKSSDINCDTSRTTLGGGADGNRKQRGSRALTATSVDRH